MEICVDANSTLIKLAKHTNFFELKRRYPDLKNKKLTNFRPKAIAKYASSTLKKHKKLSLIPEKFQNIAFQLKLSQMRFLVNLKYDKQTADPIRYSLEYSLFKILFI